MTRAQEIAVDVLGLQERIASVLKGIEVYTKEKIQSSMKPLVRLSIFADGSSQVTVFLEMAEGDIQKSRKNLQDSILDVYREIDDRVEPLGDRCERTSCGSE